MATISTVIITFNSSLSLKKCLDSVCSFSDEIIIVDSFSTDSTIDIAKSFSNVKFFQKKFEDFISQKNYANSLATSKYIFSLDSDEEASIEIADYFLKNILNLPKAIIFPRLNFIGEVPIKFGTWVPDKKLRFWEAKYGTWGGSTPHEWLILDKNATPIVANHFIYHYAYSDINELSLKSNIYVHLAAPNLNKKYSKFVLFSKLIFSPMIKFIKGYIFKMGFLHGLLGLKLEFLIAKDTWNKYKKALSISNE